MASPKAHEGTPAYPAFGEFVRTQRALAQLSLRQASKMARISNPYLSQIERGWVLPSIAVMSKLAEAFSLSAETVLMEAALASSGAAAAAQPSTEDAIQRDPRLDVEQKKALLLILASFTRAQSAHGDSGSVTGGSSARRSTKRTSTGPSPTTQPEGDST